MSTEQNKQVVLRFNKEFIEKGNTEVLKEIVADDFKNHTAAGNVRNDVTGLIQFIGMIHKGFSDIRIDIYEQLAENDLVTTRKIIHAKHTGEIMGHAATGKAVEMNVIDIVRLRDGKYVDHWGRNDIMQVIQSL
ncbi:ester cyclase [Ginsengibacter hankyongi]|uniref:Ester cyclase n=1 Tax=Ginsengibacter hankyongi TaxID=2607284 RepID=A0A5J5ICQ5_9BACT|nr:ester cyclase [Ginsengibacter hankyongi]KAA9037265.1 ester cyclase [Ginsengibacter hankyongi]